MTESIGTARLDIVVDTSNLDAGVSKAKRNTQEMGKAAQDASQRVEQGNKRQVAALERQIATLGKSRAEVIRWRIEQQTSGKVADDLSAKLDAQTRRLAASEKTMDRIGGSVKRFALARGAIAVAAGGTALAVGINNAIDFADKLNDINQRLGISAEALSGWAFAAKQTGTDIDALGVGLKKLARNMAEGLDPDSKQAKLFSALGVSVKDAQGKLRSMEDVLPEIASGFKGIESETLKAALAQELFGKSGTDLLEFLNLGADGMGAMRDRARELGVELSQGTLSAADTFNDRLEELKSASMGFSTQLAAELLPAITKLTEALTGIVKDGTAAAQTADLITVAMDGIGNAINRLDGMGMVIEGLSEGFSELLNVATAVSRLDFSLAGNLISNSTSDLKILAGARQTATGTKLSPPKGQFDNVQSGFGSAQGRELALIQARMKARKDAEDRLLEIFEGGDKKAKVKKAGKAEKSEAERQAEALERAYAGLSAQQREQIALFGQESEAAKVRYDIESGALKGLSEAKAKELIANAERLDMLHEETEAQKELDRISKAREERTAQVLDDIATEVKLLGKSAEYQDTYNKLKYAGVDANSAFGQSIIESNKALHDQADATARQIELMDTFRGETVTALSDVITGAQSASDALKNMFDNIAERVTQMIAERWIEKAFGQFGTTDTGSAGGWISKLLGFASGDTGGGNEAAALSKSAGELTASGTTLIGAASALSASAAALAAANGVQAAAGAASQTSGGGGSNWSGWLNTIMSLWGGGSANGNVFQGGSTVHAFANGGVVGSPTFFPMSSGRFGLMGEAGPEAIMPLRRLPGGRLGVEAAGHSRAQTYSPTLNQTFVVQGSPDNRTREQMARMSGREARRGMSRTGS